METQTPIREDYKETELGLLPKCWEVRKLGDVITLIMGQSPSGETYNTEGKGMPFLQGKAEFGALHPTHVKHTTKPAKIANKGSVLMSVRAPVGDVNLANIDYCIGRGLASLSMANNQFLFYLLKYFKTSIEKEGTGSTFKAINKPKLKNIIVSVPPIPEQKNIVHVLSTIQDAQEKSESLIGSLNKLKKSLMKHLFTYGALSLSESENVSLKQTELGLLSRQWSVGQIGVEFEIKSSTLTYQQMEKINDDKNDADASSVMAVKVSDMNLPNNKMYFLYSNLMKKIKMANIEKKTIPKDSIIFPKRGAAIATNKKRISTTKTVLDPNLISLVRKSDNIDVVYFYYWFQTFDLRRITVPGPTPQLNKKDVFPVLFPLPPMHEQQQIASVLSIANEKINSEERKSEALNELFKSMLSNLMSAKIRVANLEV